MRSLPLIAALTILIPAGQAMAQTYSYVECEHRMVESNTSRPMHPSEPPTVQRLRIGADQLWEWNSVTWSPLCGDEAVNSWNRTAECKIDAGSIVIRNSHSPTSIQRSNDSRTTINRRNGSFVVEEDVRFTDGSTSVGTRRTGTCRAGQNPETTAPPPLF